jgi:hypothetical protein
MSHSNLNSNTNYPKLSQLGPTARKADPHEHSPAQHSFSFFPVKHSPHGHSPRPLRPSPLAASTMSLHLPPEQLTSGACLSAFPSTSSRSPVTLQLRPVTKWRNRNVPFRLHHPVPRVSPLRDMGAKPPHLPCRPPSPHRKTLVAPCREMVPRVLVPQSSHRGRGEGRCHRRSVFTEPVPRSTTSTAPRSLALLRLTTASPLCRPEHVFPSLDR